LSTGQKGKVSARTLLLALPATLACSLVFYGLSSLLSNNTNSDNISDEAFKQVNK